MCGIAGIVGGGVDARRAALSRMLASLVHRGPDAEGSLCREAWAIGARRLAIVDLLTGDQPVADETGTVHAVLNGEIYNYREIRSELERRGHTLRSCGDTEVLVHLWQDEGPALVHRLRGMFALAVVDERTRTLFLARDRVGKKPLYWWSVGGRLLFASELKALWAGNGNRPEIDGQALEAFLGWGFVPEGQCIARGVNKLPPGHHLTVDLAGGTPTVSRYWRLDVRPDPAVSFDEAVAEVRADLDEAVTLRLRADVPIALFLSGGLDSGTVAWLARSALTAKALCVSFRGGPSEAALAGRTARHAGIELEELVVDPADGLGLLPALAEIYDEPLADSSVVPTVLVSRVGRRYAKVVLNGDGGDEALGGYRRLLAARLRQKAGTSRAVAWAGGLLAKTTAGCLHRFGAGLEAARAYDVLGPVKLLRAEVRALLGRETQGVPWLEDLYDSCRDSDEVSRARTLDLGFFLPGDLLVKMDRATMASSLEARSPFLDHRVLERAARYSPEVLLKGMRTKAVLRAATRGWLPPEVRRARKRGFEVPLADWLDGPWADPVRATLEDPRARVRELVDASALEGWREWRRKPDRQRAARALFTLVTLEHWLQRWT